MNAVTGTLKPKILLVTHCNPDCDAIGAIFLWQIATDFREENADIYYSFVTAGELCSHELIEKIQPDIVAHFDTGKLLLTEDDYFDHHPEDPTVQTKYVSTVDILADVFPEPFEKFPWLDDLRYAISCLDAGKPIRTRDPEIDALRISIQQTLQASEYGLEIHDDLQKIRIILSLIANLDSSNDEEKMRHGLALLYSWHNSERPQTELIQLTETAKEVDLNGFRTIIFPPTKINHKKLRYFLKPQKFDFVFTFDPNGKLGITWMRSPRLAAPASFEDLANRLKTEYPGNKPYFHHEKWLFYLDANGLKEEDYLKIISLAFLHLKKT